MKLRPNPFLRSSLALASALALCQFAHAVDYTWSGTTGNWTDTTWTPGPITGPTAPTDTAAINSGSVNTTNLTINSAIFIGNSATVTANAAAGNVNLGGNLTGSGILTKTGGNSLFLGGDSSGFSGTINANQSNVFFTADSAGSAAADWVIGSANVVNNQSGLGRLIKLGSLAGSGGILGGGNAVGAAATFEIGGNGKSTTFGGRIMNTPTGFGGGTASVTKVGSGTLTLSGNNTYTGGTTITAGKIAVGHASAFGSGTITLNGGTLTSNSSGAFTLTNALIANASTTSTLEATSNNLVLNGNITGSGTLNKTGSLSLMLGGDNSGFSGTINASSSNILFTADSAGSAAADWVINTGNVVNNQSGTGRVIKLGSLAGSGGNLGSNSLGSEVTFEIGGNGKTTAFSGQIVNTPPSWGGGTASVTKVGSGTLTLSATNSYGGTTTISAGSVSASNIVVSGGTSNLGNATSAVTLGAAATQGTLSYTGNNATYTRGFTIGGAGGGRLDVTTSGQTLQVNTGAVTGTGLFTVGGAGNTTINANITHTGGLTKADSGTLMLASGGTSSYSGATTITAGKLVVNGNISTSTTTVKTTGTLGGSGTLGAVIVQAGGTLAPGNSPGNITGTSLALADNANFDIEINKSVTPRNDSVTLTGNFSNVLAITTGANLNLALTGTFVLGDRFTLADYNTINGTWNGGLFNLGAGTSTLADDSVFQYGSYDWRINYDDLTNGITNSTESYTDGGKYLTLTVVPEPGAALLGGLGMLCLLRRRRSC